MIDQALLAKFYEAPGLCTILELGKIKRFLINYKEHNDLYRAASGKEPLGYTLDVELENVEAYINIKR